MRQQYAPGARVKIRDAEWIIRRVDVVSGGYQLTCDGMSEYLHGKELIFLTQLEEEIEILDPATSNLFDYTENTEIEEPYPDDAWLEFEGSEDVAVVDDWERAILEYGLTDLFEGQIDDDEISYIGMITQEDRARQIVAEIALQYDVDDELFNILTQILVFHRCHGRTRLALQKLLEGGVSADELEIVFELRHHWAGNEGYSRAYFGSVDPVAAYLTLGWQDGLAIVRYLSCEDAEEAAGFIEDCFDDWQFNIHLIEGFGSFRGYIIYLLEHADWCQPDRLPAYIDYQFFECSEVQDDCMPGSPIYMWLEENGLLFTPYPLVKRAGVVDE